MGLQDPFGDALSSSMARMILSRHPFPGDNNARARQLGDSGTRKTFGDRGNTIDVSASGARSSANESKADDGVIVVSRTTKAFLDLYPVFVDGEGNELVVPKYRAENQSAWSARSTGAENRQPIVSEQARVEAGNARSKELWKKVNPGYAGSGTSWHRSEYSASLALTAEKLQEAKFGVPNAYKHHLAKTDTSVYVEAVAKERIFAKAAALETARELAKIANAPPKSVKPTRSGGSNGGEVPPTNKPRP
jgi:hypothetical protein